MSNVVGAWRSIEVPQAPAALGAAASAELSDGELRYGELALQFAGAAGGAEPFTPEPFTLRSVTTRVSGEARVVAGSLVAAVLALEPGAEVAFTCDEALEYGVVACSGGIEYDNTPVPAGSCGRTQAGASTHAVANTSQERAYAVLLGGNPADRAGAARPSE